MVRDFTHPCASDKTPHRRQGPVQRAAFFVLQRRFAQTPRPIGGIGAPGDQRGEGGISAKKSALAV